MPFWKRVAAFLLFLLLLLPSAPVFGEGGGEESAPSESVTTDRETGKTHRAVRDDDLCRQIETIYRAAKKRAHRSSFRGYCGAYVANQLVLLGINETYVRANGKNAYDAYCKLEYTTGGYRVRAYGGKQYSLREALSAIQREDPAPRNILVGFQRGISKSGRKYGHVLFIHGIQGGLVYYSDSSARIVNDVEYKEGEPIVCSLSAFTDLYAEYKLDGVIHFLAPEEAYSASTVETSAGSSENAPAVG